MARTPPSVRERLIDFSTKRENKMKINFSTLVSSGILAVIASHSVADQTGHVYGITDRTPTELALTGATVHLASGETIEQATILIEHGVIKEVGKKITLGKVTKTIDLSGKHIYPGFIDPYTDYGLEKPKPTPKAHGQAPQYQNQRTGGNAWNDAIHAEADWKAEFKADSKAAEAWLKNGFTSVQSAKLDGIFQGQGLTVSLAEGIANDIIINSHSRHFGSFDKGTSQQEYPSSLMGSIALIRQTMSDASWYQQSKGKLDVLITGETVEYNAALDAINELSNVGLIFNADDHLSSIRAAEVFKPYNLNMAFLAGGHEYTRINEIAALNAPFIVTPEFPDKPEVGSFAAQLDVSLAELRHWEHAPSNPAVLASKKIPLAFSQSKMKKTDQFWTKVRKAVEHGLSEKDALKALTTTPAKLANAQNKVGEIAQGHFADLVIASDNIFKSGDILGVYLRGHYKEFKPLNPINFTGDYEGVINNQAVTLSLKMKNQKVTGEFVLGEEKSVISLTDQYEHKIEISADLSKLKVEQLAGVHRLTLSIKDNQLSGFNIDQNFAKAPITFVKSEIEKSEDQTKEEPSKPIEYISQVTFPNVAYGLSSLPTRNDLHFKNATVWTSESDGILENTDVLVKDGKIYKIGKELKTPRGYDVIDATGKSLTAGIIDEHSHIAISKGVNEGSDAITSEVRIGDVINPDDQQIFRALAGGTTAAQLLHGSANPIGGQAQVIKLRWGTDANTMKFDAAPPSIKFALGENVKQSNWGDQFNIRYPQSRMGVNTIVRDGFERAKEYRAQWDKYDDLSRNDKKITATPRVNYRMEALVEILESKRFIHSHSYVASEILSLMKIAEDFGFKIQTFTHILEGYKVAKEMAEHGAMASTFADWWAYKFEVYDAIPGNTCLMMQNGVTVSVNSDSGDLIRRLNTEAAKSVQYCGMSQQDAWKMVTINPAKQLKIDQYVGSIKEGKHADLVLWSGNPLSIYSQVEHTYIDGRKYFDRNAHNENEKALALEKNQLIQKVLGANGDAINGKTNGNHSNTNKELTWQYIEQIAPTWHCEDNIDFWHLNAAEQGE